jgi:hypothetical protein
MHWSWQVENYPPRPGIKPKSSQSQDSFRPFAGEEREAVLQALQQLERRVFERLGQHDLEISELKQILSQATVSSATLIGIKTQLDTLSRMLAANIATDNVSRAERDKVKGQIQKDATAAGRDTAKPYSKIAGGISMILVLVASALAPRCEAFLTRVTQPPPAPVPK